MQRVLFILGVLEDEDVDWLIEAGERQELAKDDVLIREGEPISAIYLLLDGTLNVSVSTLHDQPLAQLTLGEVVGEMSFVDGQPPSATVIATEPTVVLAIPCKALNKKLKRDIWFAARFYKALSSLLSSRLRSTVKHLQGEHWRPVILENEDPKDDLSEAIAMGSIRFDWMLRRLRDLDGNPWADLEKE